MKLTKYQIIKVQVESAGSTVSISAETDKLYARVESLYVSLPNEDSHFGSSLSLRIAEEEIFPEGFETKLLAVNQSTSPNERFFQFGADEKVEAGGSHLEGRFTDGGYTTNVKFPYTMNIYLKLINEK